jgi:hypothetical protein
VSVSLTPINGGDEVSISNGEWLALTRLAASFGEKVTPWNQCHDPQSYSPEELRSIAIRVEQIKDAADWLNELADNGGANLS